MTAKLLPKTQEKQIAYLVELLKVATRIARPMRDRVADPENVSVSELRILMMLAGEGALAGQDLAELMVMQPMNVSRALASLSDMGLVKLADNSGNRRRKPYGLTPAGRRKYEKLQPELLEVAQFVFSDMDETELAAIGTLLTKLDDRLASWESPPNLKHVPRS